MNALTAALLSSRSRSPPRSWPRSCGGRAARRRPAARAGARRVLVPFSGALDSTVLDAAIRIARADDAVLVPAYLLIVPLQYGEDSPLREQVATAMPLLEAVELAALEAGVPVDARIEKGRTLTHAVRRLWEAERFDRIVAPAPAGRPGRLHREGPRLAADARAHRDAGAQGAAWRCACPFGRHCAPRSLVRLSRASSAAVGWPARG